MATVVHFYANSYDAIRTLDLYDAIRIPRHRGIKSKGSYFYITAGHTEFSTYIYPISLELNRKVSHIPLSKLKKYPLNQTSKISYIPGSKQKYPRNYQHKIALRAQELFIKYILHVLVCVL